MYIAKEVDHARKLPALPSSKTLACDGHERVEKYVHGPQRYALLHARLKVVNEIIHILTKSFG